MSDLFDACTLATLSEVVDWKWLVFKYFSLIFIIDPIGLLDGIALISFSGEILMSDYFDVGCVDDDFFIGLKDLTVEVPILVYRLGYK